MPSGANCKSLPRSLQNHRPTPAERRKNKEIHKMNVRYIEHEVGVESHGEENLLKARNSENGSGGKLVC